MHTLPKLPYSYDALEPYMDKETLTIHHDLHHASYVKKLNLALEGHPELLDKPIEDILKTPDSIPSDIKTAVINNGGGHWNHSFFWTLMTVNRSQTPSGNLANAINNEFDSFDNFKKIFSQKALTLFGSGWTWLVNNNNNKLEILQMNNQDCPISKGMVPILTIDVWEHAYYLKYQNKRAEYITAWFKILNWKQISQNFEENQNS